MGIPANWHDDGTNLVAPNGVKVVLGFREHVIASAWDAANVPLAPQYYTKLLEQANPDLGDGDQIVFLFGDMLGYPHNPVGAMAPLKGKVVREWAGKELNVTRDLLAKYYPQAKLAQDLQNQVSSLQGQLSQASAQVAQEQQEIKNLQAELQTKPDIAALSNRLSSIGMLAKQAGDLVAEVQQQAAQPVS